MAGGGVTLETGSMVQLALDQGLGDTTHLEVCPIGKCSRSSKPDSQLLVDDGRVRLRIVEAGPESAVARVELGGHLTDRKGVNVPGVVLPVAALSAKDRADLERVLELQVDWIGLSFVQRPEDVAEAAADRGRPCWGSSVKVREARGHRPARRHYRAGGCADGGAR